jgi:DNA repair protein RecO (recombination protein O)
MAPPRSYLCEALTLKKQPLGEADLLVTLYTRDRGKLRAMAKGARRATSKLVGHLEPLTQVSLSLAQGRNLDFITQVQVVGSLAALKTDLKSIAKGLYVAELLDGFGAEASPSADLYHLAIETLESIGLHPDSAWPLRYFELQLLQLSGLMPELHCCVDCRKPLSPGQHRFSPDVGGTLCAECNPAGARVRPLSLQALKVLRLLQRGRLAEIVPLRVSSPLALELKSLLTTTVTYWLDKEIRSNSFLEHLQRESRPGVYT